MINNERVFQCVMDLLRSIEPGAPLPAELEPYLRLHMIPEPYCFEGRELETEGEVPANAYYVVTGFVLIFGYDSNLDRYVMRIYRENSLIAMNCFMRQKASEFTIWACKDTLVWSISNECMQEMYKKMSGMREFAQHTASEFNLMKEKLRSNLLSLDDGERVLTFYAKFKGLLPAKGCPIKDAWIASYLGLKLHNLRRLR